MRKTQNNLQSHRIETSLSHIFDEPRLLYNHFNQFYRLIPWAFLSERQKKLCYARINMYFVDLFDPNSRLKHGCPDPGPKNPANIIRIMDRGPGNHV